jgi:hypothetical protein
MRFLITLVIAFLLGSIAVAQDKPPAGQDKPPAGPTVRPEVGKPLQAAIELLKGKRAKEALARAKEAQAVPNKTPYETYLVSRVLGQAAASAGEPATAAAALESAAASSAAPEAERRQMLALAISQYYALKDYSKSAALASRYLQGGPDKSIRTIHVQSLYLGGQYAAAAREIAADVEAVEASGKAPPEEELQLLANAYLQSKDNLHYTRAMEKLVAYYPKRDYWLNVVHSVVTRPGFNERLAIDVARFKLEVGIMRNAGEYLDLAQLTMIEGFPAEAVRVIDKGYAAGVLGVGGQAERHKRLKELAAKNLGEDRKTIAQEEQKGGGGKDGKTLFNEGFNYVLHGRNEKGIAMMLEGLKGGSGFSRADHARLQLGYAYHLAGQKEKAIQAFKGVTGPDGASALARLWVIRLSRAA